MLKAQLHIHIKGDKEDRNIKYSVFELIYEAKTNNFDVLAITCHDTFFFNNEATKYAKTKGILLISGIEKTIEGKHVLIYGAKSDILKVNKFSELIHYKKNNQDILIIAAHPYFFLSFCLKDTILKHPGLFDAWEYSFFYTNIINPNKKTKALAKKLKKPLVGCSDVHYIKDTDITYTLIDSKKNEKSVFEAIKKGKIKVVSKPLSFCNFLFRTIRLFFNLIIKKQ